MCTKGNSFDFGTLIIALQWGIFSYCMYAGWALVEIEDKDWPSYFVNGLILNFICLPLVAFSQIQCATTEPGYIHNSRANSLYSMLGHLIYMIDNDKLKKFIQITKDKEQLKIIKDHILEFREFVDDTLKCFLKDDHTWTILTLSQNDIEITSEIAQIRENFDDRFNKLCNSITGFAAPFNDYNIQICRSCGVKFERTHHCQNCNKCVSRMDHHCPWIVNCIGAKTEGVFLLFNFYVFILCYYYAFLILWYYLIPNYNFNLQFRNPYFFPVALSVYIAIAFSCFTIFMLITMLKFVVMNTSTIDEKKGKIFEKRSLYEALSETFGSRNCLKWFIPLTHNIIHGKCEMLTRKLQIKIVAVLNSLS